MASVERKSGTQMRIGVLAVVLSGLLLAVWWMIDLPTRTLHTESVLTWPIPAPRKLLPPGVSRAEFYGRDLAPLLEKSRRQNLGSADKAIVRLHEEFDRFRAGVPEFVDDVGSWRTRFGVMKRMTRDRWRNFRRSSDEPVSEEVKQYVLAKFQSHVMSQDAVQKAVEGTIAQFKDDVTASRNRLLTEMNVALSTLDLRLDFEKPRFESFQKAFDECVTSSVQGQGQKTVGRMVVVFVASGVAGAVAERLVGQIVGLLSAEAVSAGAEAAAASGSAMASGTALGAASGWLGGPAGEIVGVGAGLAIGAGIDWWLSERFKVNLTHELTNYLDNLERDMVDGEAATTGQPAKPGLRATLRQAAGDLYDVQCKATQKALASAN